MIYKYLHSKKNKIRARSFFLAGFMLCINAYAWFVYSSNVSGTVTADVVKWAVNFYENNIEIKEFNIVVSDMYPGMPNYTKTIVIKNASSLNAEFNYSVSNLKVFGVDYSTNAVENLNNNFPFSVIFQYDKGNLEKNENLTFSVIAKWIYEKNSYYKLNSDFEFNQYLNYYDSDHNLVNVDSTNYTNYYIESDDADTYFSEKCMQYKKDNPSLPCLSFRLNLKVNQESN